MSEFLLEIFSEEIPARMQQSAAQELKELFQKRLNTHALGFSAIEAYVSPRRLALHVTGLPAKTEDTVEERRGPRTNAPQKAMDGFLKSTGLTIEQCEKRETDKGEFYFAILKNKGQPTPSLLKAIINDVLCSFPWPKSMRWTSGDQTWVRPLHHVLALFDGKTIEGFTNKTKGHRFLDNRTFAVKSFDEYANKLRKAFVEFDHTKRQTQIEKQLKEIATKHKLELVEDPALLEEVIGLVEWPVAYVGDIDPDFMDLPHEVLITAMRAHQKYFNLRDKKGNLAPKFILISNMQTPDKGKTIIAGNEKVLRARLGDAKFFYTQDLKTRLEDRLPILENIIFHEKVGTLAERVERIKYLATTLCDLVPNANIMNAKIAAILCKCDLATDMVGEFPELQGIMGAYYAAEQGENPAVAQAIREHYAPQGPGDHCPGEPVSIVVALAEKLDTLITLFAVGEKPTGSKDPYALRRAALGVIRLILENNLNLPLRKILPGEVCDDLLAFFTDRLKVYLRERGIRHDYVTAVFSAQSEDDITRLVEKAKAVQNFIATQDGQNLLAAYKRAANILKAEAKKEKKNVNAFDPASINDSLLTQSEEINLADSLNKSHTSFRREIEADNFAEGLKIMSSLRKPVDSFFDHVTVNADDEKLRHNRLNLLARIRSTLNEVADFSKIEG